MPLKQCRQCEKVFDTALIPEGMPQTCPYCGHDNSASAPPSPATTIQSSAVIFETASAAESGGGATGRVKCEWERDWRTSPLVAYINTLKAVLSSPIQYFKTLAPFTDWLAWAVLVYINNFIVILSTFALQATIGLLPLALLEENNIDLAGGIIGIGVGACAAVFIPLFSILVTFIGAAIMHFFFRYIGGSQKDMDTTTTMYGISSLANIFGVVPFVGGIVSLVYAVIILIGGGASAHEIPPSKALLSWILPTFICCCIFGGMIGLAVMIPALLA